MGYTHYWFGNAKPISPDNWANIRTEVEKLIAASPVQVLFEFDSNRPAEVTDDYIRFNGVHNDGHETFLLEREMEATSGRRNHRFACCKTARKPYDLLVCACLAVAAPYLLRVSSDGSIDEEWVEPLAWASKVLNRPVTIKFKH